MHEIVKDYYNKNYYLAHHGIKGQKWGVRNGPPYPLGESDKSTSEKAATGLKTSYGENGNTPIDPDKMKIQDWRKIMDDGGDFVLSDKSTLYEVNYGSENTDSGRKYVTAMECDTFESEFLAEDDPDISITKFKPSKNLSVAGKREQAKILQEIYGKNLRDPNKSIGYNFDSFNNMMLKEYIAKHNGNTKGFFKPIDKMNNLEFSEYLQCNPFDHNFDVLNERPGNPELKRVTDALSKKGYDAVVSMGNTPTVGMEEAPLTILKAEDSLKRK